MSAGKYMQWLMVALLALGVSGCANKGKLKSPSQIQANEAKKARKAQKEADKEQSDTDKNTSDSNPDAASSVNPNTNSNENTASPNPSPVTMPPEAKPVPMLPPQ